MKTGFKKLSEAIKKKNSRLVFGIDPDEYEEEQAKKHGGLENYLKMLIDDIAPYAVAIKPQLAFYEKSAQSRKIMGRILRYAGRKHGLIKIIDVKRGDIANTQSNWAKADIKNFAPDIVILNGYMGGEDVIKPYLEQDPKLCAYVLTATSNPSARQFQDLICGGLKTYEQMALHARMIDPARVGYIIGGTKLDAIFNIRMLEKQMGLTPGFSLAPGFGRQGASLEYAKIAGPNAVLSVSSGLTNEKYLNGKTPKDAALFWRDEINKTLKEETVIPTVTEYVIKKLIEQDLIWLTNSSNVLDHRLINKGKVKLKDAGISLTGTEEQKLAILKDCLDKKILTKDDFTTIYLNMRHLMSYPETRRLVAWLYTQMIKQSGVEFDRMGSIAYGAINIGDLASYILDKPCFLLRKERGAEMTHDDIVGHIKQGEKIIMIEDVATTSLSLLADVKMLREKYGVIIEHAFVFVKRTEEAFKACKEAGVQLHYVIDMDGLKKLVAKGK